MVRPKKEINIRMVAREADVSIATVSRVINNHSDVSEDARKKIRGILKKLSFSPARSRTKRRTVGIVLVDENSFINAYASTLISGIIDVSEASGIDTALVFLKPFVTAKTILESLRDRGCHSAILIQAFNMERQLEELSESGIPSVFLNSRIKLPNIGWIDSDAFAGGFALGQHLAELGHRSIAFLHSGMTNDHIAREKGLLGALLEHGIAERGLITIPMPDGNDFIDRARNQATSALKKSSISAIVGVDDCLAFGAIRACADFGLKVPDDISVAGFDDNYISRHFVPSLTTVRQPLFEIGRVAAEYAIEAMKPGSNVIPPRLVMPTELLIRESTGPCRKNAL